MFNDDEIEESDWETEYENAKLDADDYGLGFFVVFKDGTIGRMILPEVIDLVMEHHKNMAKS